MRINTKDLRAFQTLYASQFGTKISEKEALEKATCLLRLMELIYVPITVKEAASTSARCSSLRIGMPSSHDMSNVKVIEKRHEHKHQVFHLRPEVHGVR